MSTLVGRLRNRRDTIRRTRAVEHALRNAPSAALRNEFLEMTSRYE